MSIKQWIAKKLGLYTSEDVSFRVAAHESRAEYWKAEFYALKKVEEAKRWALIERHVADLVEIAEWNKARSYKSSHIYRKSAMRKAEALDTQQEAILKESIWRQQNATTKMSEVLRQHFGCLGGYQRPADLQHLGGLVGSLEPCALHDRQFRTPLWRDLP